MLNLYTGVSNSTLSTGPFALSLLIYITAVYLAQVGLFLALSTFPVVLSAAGDVAGLMAGLKRRKSRFKLRLHSGGNPIRRIGRRSFNVSYTPSTSTN
jgi:hypothetical protein